MTPKKVWLAVGLSSVLFAWLTLQPRSPHPTTAKVPQPVATGAAVTPSPSASASLFANRVAPPTAPAQQSELPELSSAASPDPVSELHFGAFRGWQARFEQSRPDERPALEAEGVLLATQRRAAMFSLIQTNPKRAIELALLRSDVEALPASVRPLVEEQISARGDYAVIAALPLPGLEKEVQPIQRTMTVGEKSYRAFVYGSRKDHPTRRGLPFHGVALGDVLAIDADPVRVRSRAVQTALKAEARDAICAISGQPADSQGEATVLDIGGELVWTCRYDHIDVLRQQQLAAAGTAGSGTLDGVTSESNYTEGRKRIIVFRVAFPNVTTPALTILAGNQMLTNINTFWRSMSYGRTTAAMPGQGSDVVLVTLTLNSTNYDGDAGRLRGDVRAAATASGIDLSKYDFDITCVGSTPAYTFAGLGYVGAPGVWLANSYFGVATACHELGHNLGNPHANYWDTSGQSDIGPGGNEEYGDPYDIMGGGGAYAGHYVNKFKYRIGWISSNDLPKITTSGLYRIYSHDNIDATGLRGLRFRKDSTLDYHVEFRQLYTGNNWMMNGLKLMWGDPNGWTSQLIDTTPGSASGKNDAPIAIGRTWSDAAANVHITPIGKGNTYPESLDLVVNFGPFAGNLPPVVHLSASSLSAAAGASIAFTATASDPNGNALAYYWDFDDGGYSLDNSASQSHTFATAGDYTVHCTVSDMRGGRTTDSIVVRIGSPTTFSISGRVLDNNKPVEGVLLKAGSRSTYSESDGTYSITRLAAGTYSVTAALYPYTWIRPWSPANVVVGPNATNIDFVNLPGGLSAVTLVATGSVWKYLDNGSDQGSAWTAPSFNDGSWFSGTAQLGYGEGDEATVVSYGPDANNKYITTYFRRAFNVADPSAVTNLVLRLQRDDGGIVYLNGTEVFRDSMPSGAVNYRTLAATTTDGEWVQTNLSRSLLVAGTNVLAVEIHQVLGTSSDISFDLSLAGTAATSSQSYSALYVSSPADASIITGPTNITVAASANVSGNSFTLLEFYDGATKFAEAAAAPYTVTLPSAALGSHVLRVRGTLASGGYQTSAPVNVTVTAPVPPAAGVTLIPQGSVWKYLDNGTDQGTGWTGVAFNDAAWASGPAQLGYGDGDEATVVRYGADANNKYITTYFRRAFTIDDPSTITNLAVSLLRDDGGIVYLNGTEIFRSSMPTGAVTYATLALSATDDGTIFFSNSVSPALLNIGTNVVAVEIHQTALNSSDISFDLRLTGLLSSNRARGLYITSPVSGERFAAPAAPVFGIVAVAGGGAAITNVTLYAGSTAIASDGAPPFAITWTNPPVGTFGVLAVGLDTTGASITSAPVTVTVSAPPTGLELVSPASLWHYLDDGSDQGTAWRARAFDDSDWRQGYARLGYGGDGEVTVVNFGPDPAKRFITTYFRRSFVMPSTSVTGLALRMTRDDGAVVYLNGVEVHRSNMPTNVISYNSLASATVGGSDETAWSSVPISASSLVTGANVIAVEVHQAAIGSSDLGFDLQLIAETGTNISAGVYLTSPAEGAFVTLPGGVAVSAFATAGGGADVSYVELYADGSLLHTVASAPYSFAWTNAAIGSHALTARAVFSGGTVVTSPAVNITVDGPPVQAAAVLDTYIATGSAWRFWSNGVTPATNWTSLDYNDAGWQSAPAKFGWGLDGEITTLPSGRTHYFRRAFNCTNALVISDLIVQLQRDDGAIVYLNGVELFRSNMPAGVVLSNTLASSTVDGLDEQTYFISTLAPGGLRQGTNVLAVEVHQASATSSDMGFDLQLNGSGTTAPHIVLGQPLNGQVYEASAHIPIEAYAWPGSSRSVARVEVFSETNKLAELTAAPYTFVWSNAALGTHSLTARMVDNFGAAQTSSAVQVQIVLLASNSVWKYLDNGTDQGFAWLQTNFDDSAWLSGAARLGYGGDGENTTLSYGPNASAKYITTYFRRSFIAPADMVVTNLICRLVRDDGAVVWLNGRELYRSNMPGGTITATTLAASPVSNADEKTFFVTAVAGTNVHAGTNVVAVEIHQDAGNSSDIGFDLEIAGEGYAVPVASAAPVLVAGTPGSAQFTITWPTAAGWGIYSSLAIGPNASWQPVSAAVTTSNGQSSVTISTAGPAAFFRLQKE